MAACFGAVHVPYVYVRWPDHGKERPKHVAIEVKLITKYTTVVYGGNYKPFVYLVKCAEEIFGRNCIY
jgi:hypothetical protein